MSERRIRVLVVDDSAFARKVLRESLQRQPDIEVVGIANDGLDALEKVGTLRPDVITLDLVMPHLDGLGVLRALAATPDAPKVVVISTAELENERVIAALEAGAVDFVHKPTALATDRLYEIAVPIAQKVRAAAMAKAPSTRREQSDAVGASRPPLRPTKAVVVVGTSTGGPQALARLVTALPADFPAPMVIVLHIPAGYTAALARRLDSQCALEVVEGYPDVEIRPGRIVLACAGEHLRIERHGAVGKGRMSLDPLSSPHRPSVDVLFQSAAESWGKDALGVILTGMGNDGLEGARAIRAAGGRIVTEAESSAVIYGMPRAVQEAGLSSAEVDLEELVPCLLKWVSE